jgi:capsular polysaccharide biosynthesis protein
MQNNEPTQVTPPAPYVRTVEVVALDTFSTLLGFEFQRFTMEAPTFSMYGRVYRETPETIEVATCRDIDVLPRPAWKVCGGGRYFVDEIGHTEKLTIKGLECWPEFGGKFHIRREGPVVDVPRNGERFFLLGGDENHYHWVLNFVPRLMLLERLREQSSTLDEAKIVVPASLSENSLGLLQALGYGPERLLRLGHEAVWRFEELVVPNLFPHFEYSPAVFAWYRHKLGITGRAGQGRRVVISRGDAPGTHRRRVVNEPAMIDALSKFGFEAHNLGMLTLAEQIKLFSEAEMVVGPHGAGFANMVFCRPGAKALVLENSWNHFFMVDMLNVSGAHARSMVCEDVFDAEYETRVAPDPATNAEVRRNRDMTADVDKLVGEVESMLAI